MAKAYGYIIVYNNNGDIVYQHKGSGGDYGGTVSLNNNIVTISSDYAPQVEPIDDSDPEFPDRWSTVIDTGEVNVSNLTNPTSLQIVLPYKASKIRYFGGSSGSFADSNGSGYSAAIINNGETITLASNNYDTGGGCAIQYYEEAAPKVSVDLATLPGWSSLSSGSHSITIVAKADGYRDSEPSSAVSVTKGPQEYTDCITFTGETSDFTLKATNKEWDGIVEYSTDHNTWKVWNGAEITSVSGKLYLRGSGNTTFMTDYGARFVLSARAACSGNIQTLLEYSNPPATTLATYCYYDMFNGCTNLITAPELPATTLADYCYNSMFNDCTNLTKAPELPATTLASFCYSDMFYGCASLTQAPELPATTLASSCYSGMFYGCTSLTQAPELPATTLADVCYESMFCDCIALKISSTQSSEYPTAWRIPSSGTISSTDSNWNSNMLSGTGGTFTSDPNINTTYYGAWTK